MEKFPTYSEAENKYDFLKESFFNGSITLEELRDKLIEWDQSTLSRDASDDNLKFLQDPDFVEYVNRHPETQDGYNKLLSFMEFHVAQRLVMNNRLEALDHFRKSLDHARTPQTDNGWPAYVEGTILYLEGKEIPEEIISKVKQSRNIEILKNFNSGLKERGWPSYMEDYSK